MQLFQEDGALRPKRNGHDRHRCLLGDAANLVCRRVLIGSFDGLFVDNLESELLCGGLEGVGVDLAELGVDVEQSNGAAFADELLELLCVDLHLDVVRNQSSGEPWVVGYVGTPHRVAAECVQLRDALLVDGVTHSEVVRCSDDAREDVDVGVDER